MTSLREDADAAVNAIPLDRLHAAAGAEHGSDHLGTVWYAGPLVGQLADAGSTLLVLARTPGSREGNPGPAAVLGDRSLVRQGAFVAGKLAVGVGFALGAHMLSRGGHTRTAKAFSGIATVFGVGAAVWNLGQLRAHA